MSKLTKQVALYLRAMSYSQTVIAAGGGTPKQSRARAQAIAAIAVLFPFAVIASYAGAVHSGTARPELSALITTVIALAGSVAILRAVSSPELYPHARFGACNLVTLTRAAGIAVLAGLVPVATSEMGWVLAAMATALLALDGVDGWLARRSGLQSAFGARFDVESDVVFALVTACLAIAMGHVGAWFLLLGMLRPLYLGAARIWPALTTPLPEAIRRKRIAGAQMAAQVVLLAPVAAPHLGNSLGAAVLIVTLLSFAVDIRWQIRQRGAA